MTAERHVDVSLTAVLALDSRAAEAASTLELRGPLERDLLHAALERVAADRPHLRRMRPHTVRQAPGHHVLRFDAGYPLGVLADLLTAAAPAAHGTGSGPSPGPRAGRPAPALPEPLALTPLQHDLLAGTPHRQVAQLVWRWHGPLDTGRFTAAWQQVFDHESVLRTAFVFTPQPHLALHARAVPEVSRHAHGTLTRQALMEQEAQRGFDLGRPGLLRAALLDGAPQQPPAGLAPPTDIVLTYHRGLLDGRSVRLLLQEFYRAYLTAGTSGGERRPDLRDYGRWLAAQDTAPARAYFQRTSAQLSPALPRARPGAVTGRHGTGRTLARLTRSEAVRLAHWAARFGATESSALQAVWAMILFTAHGTRRAAAPVSFSVTVSGRGIPMEGIARVPGPFANPLPLSLTVDPAATVAQLLREVTDRALDLAAYEWVCAGQIRTWLGYDADAAVPETVLCFEHRPRQAHHLTWDLAAQGIHVEDARLAAGHGAFAVGVLAHHDSMGRLVLTAVHDRGRLHDDQVAQMLAHSAQLLRQLPAAAETITVAGALAHLAGTDIPRLHDDRPAGSHRRLRRLRPAARPGAATICLIAPPGYDDSRHSALARHYTGPEAVTTLRADVARLPLLLTALQPLLQAGEPLILGGFSGAGALACELARHLAADLGHAPLVVLGADHDDAGGAGDDGRLRDLAHALHTAARRTEENPHSSEDNLHGTRTEQNPRGSEESPHGRSG
ncbi:condensation domain-containing protein [Streptomyces sp. S.PNR 29]|uniref:condensation domain-containing protein n=1 Tax=Streptomyces sp. S.PNR 29 TaxID=2973805 RepID=UPI0025B1DF71|nr:condensation domain-containing protein [Streptomyces sp. S.PNR 29]MDN0197925.1 condensation domain-containing protein [Streptomyces sp. S.PNR 29]